MTNETPETQNIVQRLTQLISNFVLVFSCSGSSKEPFFIIVQGGKWIWGRESLVCYNFGLARKRNFSYLMQCDNEKVLTRRNFHSESKASSAMWTRSFFQSISTMQSQAFTTPTLTAWHNNKATTILKSSQSWKNKDLAQQNQKVKSHNFVNLKQLFNATRLFSFLLQIKSCDYSLLCVYQFLRIAEWEFIFHVYMSKFYNLFFFAHAKINKTNENTAEDKTLNFLLCNIFCLLNSRKSFTSSGFVSFASGGMIREKIKWQKCGEKNGEKLKLRNFSHVECRMTGCVRGLLIKLKDILLADFLCDNSK